MRKKLTFFLLLLSIGIAGLAQTTFTGKAPEAVIAGDKFQLVYTLNKEGSDIRLPQMDDFQILMGPSISRQYSMSNINGKITRENIYSFTYILKANKDGSYKIAPATIEVDGKQIESNSIQIQVVKGDASTQQRKKSTTTSTEGLSGDDLFITIKPSKSNVYQGESLVLTTKIYTRVDLEGLSDIKQPELQEFIMQKIAGPDKMSWTMENIKGRTYNVGTYERKLLFPQKAGKIAITPTEVEFMVKQRVARRSQSIFDDFFESNYRTVKKRVKSKPLTIHVKPLPKGRPAEFTGGVGNMSMKVTTSKNQAKVNDGITLKVDISGTGNLKLIDGPKLKLPGDFDDFDPKITNKLTNTVAGMKGTKTYEYLIIPRHAGTFTIPSVEFAYFNPATKKYQSVSSGPITIEVEKGDQEEGPATVITGGGTKEDVKFIGKDIRFIKTGSTTLKPVGTFLFGSLSFVLGFVFPAFLFVLLFFINQKRIKENANIQLMKTKKANKMAKKRLKKSAHFLKTGEKESFYEEVLKALWGYLSDKLSIPVSELSKDNARNILTQSNVSEELTERFMEVLDTCEFARYSPASGSGEMDKLYQKTLETISKLENQIKR
ncbi:protein BatD [Marinilabiliaceae bacterium JC017]|nr:protein BatD [Marinilabiliaceae bacterium JC017]